MKKTLIAIAIAATGSQLFAATASSIDEAFTKGARGGALSAMGVFGSEDDSVLYGHADLYFKTASFQNIRANIGLSGIGIWWKDDAIPPAKDKSSLHTANIGYFTDRFTIAAGRQEFDLVLAPHHYQAAYGELKVSSQAKILAAYIKSAALPRYDVGPFFSDYEELNEDGVFALDVKFQSGDIKLNPYYYFLPDVAMWLGGKFEFSQFKSDSGFGLTGHLALSSEDDDSGAEDGFFAELQGDLKLNSNIGFFGGFALTGSDGIGTIGGAGKEWHKRGANQRANMMNPFWDGGAQIFLAEALTLYAGAEFERDRLWAGAMIGVTDADDETYSEINLRGEYAITKAFRAEAALVTGKFGDDYVDGSDTRTQVGFGVRYIF
ncbi:MAG: Opr family porin [Helicobacteraceae bacterium]|jgi:hypothetical protein|nr:Opr family porin [Helicobacteraceae bacterium]